VSSSENIEEEWENLKEFVTKAAKEGICQKKQYRRRKGLKIWTEETEQAVQRKQKHYRKYLSNHSEVKKEGAYNKVRNETNNLVKRAYQDSWERFIANIEHDIHGTQNVALNMC
jgi:hypothetical protein